MNDWEKWRERVKDIHAGARHDDDDDDEYQHMRDKLFTF